MSINKIFEIGVMKTGTSSLGAAYKQLGFKDMKWHPAAYDKFIESQHTDYKSLFDIIDQYEAFQDGPWHDCDFRKLDKHYPNSKFIILERDDESWIRSMELHNSPIYNINKIPDEYLHDEWVHDRSNTIDRKLKWKKEKYNTIKDYFKDRQDDLLIMNICGGEGWEKLCPFLNKKILSQPFPRKNVSAVEDNTRIFMLFSPSLKYVDKIKKKINEKYNIKYESCLSLSTEEQLKELLRKIYLKEVGSSIFQNEGCIIQKKYNLLRKHGDFNVQVLFTSKKETGKDDIKKEIREALNEYAGLGNVDASLQHLWLHASDSTQEKNYLLDILFQYEWGFLIDCQK